jgi:hypothetical protein
MDKNPYLARLRELAPDIDEALEAEFPHRTETGPVKANLRPLDPFAAYLVLISKMGALFPALAACCAVFLAAPLGAPLPPIARLLVLALTACAYVAAAGVGRMEAVTGLWKWPWRGEAKTISALRFMGLHFYPARLSTQG